MAVGRYSLLQRLIHWAVAICVIGALIAGFTLGTLGFEGARDTFGIEVTNAIYKYHKSFGVTILGLMLLRLALRIIVGRPAHGPDLPAFNRVASEIVHGLLYILLILQPIVGWMATAAGGFPIEFYGTTLPGFLAKDPPLSEWLYYVHRALGFAILGLASLHIAAALMHWRVLKDGVMRRMSLP